MILQFNPVTLSERLHGDLHNHSLTMIEQAFPNTPVLGLEERFESIMGGMADTISKAINRLENNHGNAKLHTNGRV